MDTAATITDIVNSIPFCQFSICGFNTNWRAVRAYDFPDVDAGVYVIRDSIDQIIYVGRSKSVCDRLNEHVTGIRSGWASDVGRYINTHFRDSLDWCISIIYPQVNSDSPSPIDDYNMNNLCRDTELWLIRQCHPHFNSAGRKRGARSAQPIPVIPNTIANEGMAISL